MFFVTDECRMNKCEWAHHRFPIKSRLFFKFDFELREIFRFKTAKHHREPVYKIIRGKKCWLSCPMKKKRYCPAIWTGAGETRLIRSTAGGSNEPRLLVSSNLLLRFRLFLKEPKHEILGLGIFAQIRPIWIGYLGTRPKNPKKLHLGPFIALYLPRFLC